MEYFRLDCSDQPIGGLAGDLPSALQLICEGLPTAVKACSITYEEYVHLDQQLMEQRHVD